MHAVRRKLLNKRQIIGICFLAPAIIFYMSFMAYPLIQTFRLALTDWSGFGEYRYIGLKNYFDAFNDPVFRTGIFNSIYFAFFSAMLSVVLGILCSWLLLYLRRKESNIVRTIFFTPNMISPTITGLIFLFVFTEDIGLLNVALRAVGFESLATAWLTNPMTVRNVIVVITAWRQFGLVMVLCFGGLQNIPDSFLEAARLDGAGEGQICRYILIPLIRPQIELSTMFTLIGGLKIYDTVVSLTAGGPARMTVVMPMWIVESAFSYSRFGYASAMCIIFVMIVFIFMRILRRVFRGESYEF